MVSNSCSTSDTRRVPPLVSPIFSCEKIYSVGTSYPSKTNKIRTWLIPNRMAVYPHMNTFVYICIPLYVSVVFVVFAYVASYSGLSNLYCPFGIIQGLSYTMINPSSFHRLLIVDIDDV